MNKYILLLGLVLEQSLVICGVTMADLTMNHKPSKAHKLIPGKAPELEDATDAPQTEDLETPVIVKRKTK